MSLHSAVRRARKLRRIGDVDEAINSRHRQLPAAGDCDIDIRLQSDASES
jgi:hypothetical protein